MASDSQDELSDLLENTLHDTGSSGGPDAATAATTPPGHPPNVESVSNPAEPTRPQPALPLFNSSVPLQEFFRNHFPRHDAPVALPPGTSPEEMLQNMQGQSNDMLSVMRTHFPALRRMQLPEWMHPSYQKPEGGNSAPGALGNRDMMFQKSLDDLFSLAENVFKALDAFQQGAEATVAGIAQQQAASSTSTASTATEHPQDPSTSFLVEQIKSAVALGPGLASSMAMKHLQETLVRDEAFLRSTLQKTVFQLQSLKEDDPSYPYILSSFGLFCLHLYEITFDEEDRTSGIEITSKALVNGAQSENTQHLMPIFARCWSYGQRLLARDTGDAEKLTSAITLLEWTYRKANQSTVVPPHPKNLLHNELACSLYQRYLLLEDTLNLDAAIEHLQVLVAGDAPTKEQHCQLGHAYLHRFHLRGELDDLHGALNRSLLIVSDYNALADGPLDQDKDYNVALGLHLQALCLQHKSQLESDPSLLDTAIHMCRTAIPVLKEADPLQIRFKCDLSLLLILRFQCSTDRDTKDVVEAETQLLSAVVSETAEHNTHVPLRVVLGLVQALKAETVSEMDEGIQLLSRARKDYAGPKYVETRIEELVSRAYFHRYNTYKSADDLQDALSHARLALDNAVETSPQRAELALSLGRMLMTAFSQDNNASHCEQALSHFKWAAQGLSGNSIVRFQAAIAWADAAEACHSETLVDALEYGLHLLSNMAWAGNRMSVQYRTLSSQSSGFASRAATYAIDHGQLEKAVLYLEMGRNIIWNQSLQFRGPTKEFSSFEEGLNWMASLNEQDYLAWYLSRSAHDDSLGKNQERMEEIMKQWPAEMFEEMQSIHDRMIATLETVIKAQGEQRMKDHEEFQIFKEKFMKASREATMHTAAKRWQSIGPTLDSLSTSCMSPDLLSNEHLAKVLEQGPIVILSTYKTRCDAVILHSNVTGRGAALRHLSLPEMTSDEAYERAESFREGVHLFETQECTRQEYEDVFLIPTLQELWRRVVNPVLEDLRNHGEVKDRIWWYPTGALAFLPIHAAGPYEDEQPNLPDLLPCSYTPSLRSLIRASKSETQPFDLLAIGLSETPGHCPLPGSEKEIEAIREQLKGMPDADKKMTVLLNEDATVYKASKAILGKTWLHFACHADQDDAYPFNSCFFLHDNALSLSKLMQLDLTRVQFAMLSACLTSAGDAALPDESIHLAAGMQFAGARSVVATMWSVVDGAALRATKALYHHLMKDGEDPDPAQAAKALQLTLRDMKKSKVPLAFRVPFIHTGI